MVRGSGVINLGLGRMKKILSKMNFLQNNLSVIHVAGTNGKGTICNMLYHALKKSNYNVCMFTSPYIRTPNDSIVCSKRGILSKTRYKLMKKHIISKADKKNELTNFEITTLVALKWFIEKSPDFAIIEVGVGGEGDATNVFQKPACCVLTSISLDHIDLLGKTLKDITVHKCGIFKHDSPIVAVEEFIPQECRKVVERMAQHSKLFWVKTPDKAIDYRDTLRTAAEHVLHTIGVNGGIPKETPLILGRLSELKHPIYASSKLILDGAHNQESAIALGNHIALTRHPTRHVNWILGFSKDCKSLVTHLQIRSDDTCLCVPFPPVVEMPWISCESPTKIATTLNSLGYSNVSIHDSILEAINCTDPNALTVVSGSLYLVGEYARTFLGPEKNI